MLKGPGRSGTEQNHIEAEFAMKGTHPPQAGLSFHGFFKIAGPAGEFGSAPQASGLLEKTSGPVPQASGLLEKIFALATAGLGIEWPFSSVCPKNRIFLGFSLENQSLCPTPGNPMVRMG